MTQSLFRKKHVFCFQEHKLEQKTKDIEADELLKNFSLNNHKDAMNRASQTYTMLAIASQTCAIY